jgi:hypothetical protein
VDAFSELVHQAFATAAIAAAASRQHEKPLSTEEGTVYRASEGGMTLAVRLTKPGSQWIVTEARYSGAGAEQLRGVLEIFCRCVEDLPLREAADHGAIHALELLRGDASAKSVPGILTPRNAGTAFAYCERLIRAILAEHAAKTGEQGTANFWNPALSATWRAQSDAQRIASLNPIVERFRTRHHLTEDDVWIAEVEKTRRIVVGFGSDVDYRDKPRLLMQLEVEIRRETGDRLELFMSEVKDSNPIRRLTPDEEAS